MKSTIFAIVIAIAMVFIMSDAYSHCPDEEGAEAA